MARTLNITLDLYNENRIVYKAKQGDANSRFLLATITELGVPFSIPTNNTVYLKVRKPDETCTLTQGVISDGKALVELTNQTLAVAGIAYCEIRILQNDPIEDLKTIKFTMQFDSSVFSDEIVESTDQFTALQEALAAAGSIGHVADLHTIAKDTLVDGVNELADNQGTMADLTTTADTLVGAINELDSEKEDKSNKVTSISGASTDTQYPSAKLTYDQLATKEPNLPTTPLLPTEKFLNGNKAWAVPAHNKLTDLNTDTEYQHMSSAEKTKLNTIARGSVRVGLTNNVAGDLVAKTDKQILIGDGTDLKSVAVSGDVTISNTGVTTIGADKVDNNKLANMTRGTVKVGGASDAPTDLNAKTSGNILIGDGTDLKSVAVTGDITITSAGVTAIGNNKVTNSKLAQMNTKTIKGNDTGSTANAKDLTVAETKALLDIDDLETAVIELQADVNTLDADKMDKATTDISVAQINKNLGKFDQTFMTDDFLQQISGNTPVNAVPADKSITTNKLADKCVTALKTDFIVADSINLINPKYVVSGRLTDTGTLDETNTMNYTTGFIAVNNGDNIIASYTNTSNVRAIINFSRVVCFDANMNFVSSFASATSYTIGEGVSFARFSYSNSVTDFMLEKGINISSTYVPYTEKLEGVMIDDDNLKEGAVSEEKLSFTVVKSVNGIQANEVGNVNIPVVTNLTNKTIVSFGDSITQDVDELTGYTYYIEQYTGANVINQGYGGTSINSHIDPNFDAFGVARLIDAKLSGDWSLQNTALANWAASEVSADNNRAITFNTQMDKLKAIDFNNVYACTLAYGANSNGATIGTAEPDNTLTYFAGSISYVIKRLQENYPQLRIVILGHMFKVLADPSLDRSLELIEGCKLAAEYNNVPWYDSYHNTGFNQYNFMTTYSDDGKHPNDLGKIRLGERFSTFLTSHI